MSVQFDLVSPERRLASLNVDDVQIPGSEGDLTAMEGHEPIITTLRPGIVRAGGDKAFVVIGGFAEIKAQSVSVLAERAVALEEATPEVFEAFLDDLRETEKLAEDKDKAAKAIEDLMAVKATLPR